LAVASSQSYRSEGKREADSGDTFGLHDVSNPVQVNSAPQHDYETGTQEQLRAASGSIADLKAAAAGPGVTCKQSHSHLSTDEKAETRYLLLSSAFQSATSTGCSSTASRAIHLSAHTLFAALAVASATASTPGTRDYAKRLTSRSWKGQSSSSQLRGRQH